MEPIPFFYDSINRNAIVIKPKKPLYDWVNYIFPDTPVTGKEEANVYLLREKDSPEAVEQWLKRNFDKIFINELNDWSTEEQDWPQKRTFKLFQEWFDHEVHTMILDMEETDIIKE